MFIENTMSLVIGVLKLHIIRKIKLSRGYCIHGLEFVGKTQGYGKQT